MYPTPPHRSAHRIGAEEACLLVAAGVLMPQPRQLGLMRVPLLLMPLVLPLLSVGLWPREPPVAVVPSGHRQRLLPQRRHLGLLLVWLLLLLVVLLVVWAATAAGAGPWRCAALATP